MSEAEALEQVLTNRNIEHHETFGDLLDVNKESSGLKFVWTRKGDKYLVVYGAKPGSYQTLATVDTKGDAERYCVCARLAANAQIEHMETLDSMPGVSAVVWDNGEVDPIDATGIIRPVRMIRIEILAQWCPEVMNQYPSFRDMGIEAVRESLEQRDIWPWRGDWVSPVSVKVEEI